MHPSMDRLPTLTLVRSRCCESTVSPLRTRIDTTRVLAICHHPSNSTSGPIHFRIAQSPLHSRCHDLATMRSCLVVSQQRREAHTLHGLRTISRSILVSGPHTRSLVGQHFPDARFSSLDRCLFILAVRVSTCGLPAARRGLRLPLRSTIRVPLAILRHSLNLIRPSCGVAWQLPDWRLLALSHPAVQTDTNSKQIPCERNRLCL